MKEASEKAVGIRRLDDLVAAEFSRLSVSEREQALFSIHGVNETIQETPELVQASLKDFEDELTKIGSACYAAARKANARYIESPKLCLKFLRAEKFQAAKAAQRFVKYLELKQSAFGPERVARDIRLSDFETVGKRSTTILLLNEYVTPFETVERKRKRSNEGKRNKRTDSGRREASHLLVSRQLFVLWLRRQR